MEVSAAEKKRKRLEAWRRRQQDTKPTPKVAISISLSHGPKNSESRKKTKSTKNRSVSIPNPLGGFDDDEDEEEEAVNSKKRKALLTFSPEDNRTEENDSTKPSKRRKWGSRWDATPQDPPAKKESAPAPSSSELRVDDALDKFMERLEAGAFGSVPLSETKGSEMLSVDVGGSVMRLPKLTQQAPQPSPISGGVITSEQISRLSKNPRSAVSSATDPDALYSQSDWESDAQAGDNSEVRNLLCTPSLGIDKS